MTDRTCLAGETAACNGANDIELANVTGNAEGLVNDELQGVQTEIFVDGTTVNGDCAGAGIQANAGNGTLSSAGSVEIGLSTCISQLSAPPIISLRKQRASEPAVRVLRLHIPSDG